MNEPAILVESGKIVSREEVDSSVGSNYLGAMRIAVEMIDMCDSYSRLLQMLDHLNNILRSDKIEAIFPSSE